MEFDFQTVCHSTLLKGLPERTEEVLARRFGLRGKRETLESIGQHYGVTRERVRQIEEDGLRLLEKRAAMPECQKVFRTFTQKLKEAGSLKKEDILLTDLGGKNLQNHALFLLSLGKPFQRFAETEDFHAFWTIDKSAFPRAKKAVNLFIQELKKKQKPLALPKNIPSAYVEISKKALKGLTGLYGLKDWPEINPRGIKDKAFIVLKKEQKPLHFTEVATLIGNGALRQTVHNELIKDSRFVLVGRGLYALREWGYTPGIVREVIAHVLQESKKPLGKDLVVDKVLMQRYVKPSTVLLNLQNKKYFLKTAEGKYTVREV